MQFESKAEVLITGLFIRCQGADRLSMLGNGIDSGSIFVSGFFFAFPMLLAGDIALISTK